MKIFKFLLLFLAISCTGLSQQLQPQSVKALPVLSPSTQTVRKTMEIPVQMNGKMYKIQNQDLSPYLSWEGLLTQTSTSAPTATVLYNTLGGTITWTRDSAGTYIGKLLSTFTADKCQFFGNIGFSGTSPYMMGITRLSDSTFRVRTTVTTTGAGTDALLNKSTFSIRVWR